MAAKRGIDWNEVPLGRYTDDELAARIGVTKRAVCAARLARDIPPVDRALAPFTASLSKMEREDLAALDEAVGALADADAVELSFRAAASISLVSGWQLGARHARDSGGDGKDKARLRATRFRFIAPGRRAWSPWMDPRSARVWLLKNGWVDAARARIAELRARTAMEGARA